MLHKFMLMLCLSCAAEKFMAQDSNLSDSARWRQLLQIHQLKEARTLCTGWLDAAETRRKAEAHKCLANVALYNDEGAVLVQGNDAGGGSLSEAPSAQTINSALQHLNAALQLTPQDLSIHQGRMHLLQISFRFDEMAKALDESCIIYKGKEGVEPWLDYVSELFQDGHFQAALGLLEVLDRHFPNSHQVLGNLGTVHAVLKEDKLAIQYLQRAVKLAPQDPIDNWDLAREYDFSNQIKLAEQQYQRALSLETDVDQKRSNQCLYAEFVQNKLHDAKRACKLQKTSCPAEQQIACLPVK